MIGPATSRIQLGPVKIARGRQTISHGKRRISSSSKAVMGGVIKENYRLMIAGGVIKIIIVLKSVECNTNHVFYA
jgi:hypothetical protein